LRLPVVSWAKRIVGWERTVPCKTWRTNVAAFGVSGEGELFDWRHDVRIVRGRASRRGCLKIFAKLLLMDRFVVSEAGENERKASLWGVQLNASLDWEWMRRA
jgi:hypothetical protein